MFRSTILLAAVSALASVASAQANYSAPGSGNLTIDIDQIPAATKNEWCLGQEGSCRDICGGQAYPNSCDSTTLDWICTCTSGAMPNISAYASTIPSHICETWYSNCVDANAGNLTGLDGCKSVSCGTKDPASALAAASSSAAAAAAASTSSSATTTTASSTASSTAAATSSGAAIAMHVARDYGTGIVFTGLLALFGLAL